MGGVERRVCGVARDWRREATRGVQTGSRRNGAEVAVAALARIGAVGHMDWIRGCVGVLLAVTLSLCGLSWAAPANAQQIVVEGAHVDPSTLKPYFSGTDPASIERGVDDLRATGLYSNVSARVENGRIVVSLAGGEQIINRVAFEGNKQIESKQLEVEVQSKPHTAYNEATAEADIGRIKDAYKKYGRNEATVTKRLVQLPNGRVDLVFTINEGGKDRDSGDQVCRQSCRFELSPARAHADHHDELAVVAEEH